MQRSFVYGALILSGGFVALEGVRHLILGMPKDFALWHLLYLTGLAMLWVSLFPRMGLTGRFCVYGTGTLLLAFAVLQAVQYLGFGLPEGLVRWHLVYVAGFALLLLGPLGWFLRSRVLRPIARLTEANRLAIAGDVDLFIPQEEIPDDEIGEVMRTRNEMLEELFRKERRLVEQARQAALGVDVGVALTRGNNLREILQGCAEAVVWRLDAAFARIWTLNPEADALELQASAGMYTHLDGPHSRILIGSKLKIAMIARVRRPHLTNSIDDDPLISDHEWVRREGMVAFAGYPLIIEDQLLGVIAMFARQPLTEYTLDVLSSVSDEIAMGIEHKRSEEALRESQAQYRNLFEEAPIGIYRTTCDGRILAGNPALARMLGYASFEGLACRDLEKEGFEPDCPRRHFKELLERTGEVKGLESAWKRSDHSTIFVRENAKAIRGTDGAVLYYEGTVEDITERRRADEERTLLCLAVEQAAESIVITDPDGAIVYANPAFERVTGYSRTEVLGQNPRILKSGRQDAAFYRRMWAALARGEVWSGQFTNRRKNGSLYDEEAIISPVRDAAGRVTHYVAVKRDVTQEIALEAQFRQVQKMETIGTLAAGIAHDFNNLLTPILANIQLIALDAPDAMRPCIEDVKTAALQAAGLVRQLLFFSRQNRSAHHAIDIGPIVKETARLLKQTIDRRIGVDVQIPDNLWRVEADTTGIQQVVMNLCINARDAIQECLEGRVEKPGHRVNQSFHIAIKVDLTSIDQSHCERRPDAPAGAFVRLKVSDNGAGMDEETQRRIFEPFFTTKDFGRGTGLGLAAVYGIVQQCRGWIEVQSVPGEGSQFSVYLPRHKEEAGVEGDDVPVEPTHRGTETVLVVDDEESSRISAERILNTYGYTLMFACDGMEALKVYARASEQIDLVLLDLNMPMLSGLDVLRRFRMLGARVPVLLCSGYLTEDDGKEFEKFGAAGFIPKPYTMDRLALAVREALDGRLRS